MVMPIRKQKRLLLTVSFALGLAVVASLGVAALPVSVEGPTQTPEALSGGQAAADGRLAGPLNDYAVIWQRDLRKALYYPKPVVKVRKPAPKPKLTVQLLGTALEPGFTYAMLRGKSGQTQLVAVGQSLDGAEVVEVATDSVTVKFHGDLITLKIQSGGGRR